MNWATVIPQNRCSIIQILASVKKGALKNFVNFSGKHLCWSLFLIKLQAFFELFFYMIGTITQSSLDTLMHRSSRPEVFCKRVFLEILQNSQENTCARVSFLTKLQAEALQNTSGGCFWMHYSHCVLYEQQVL